MATAGMTHRTLGLTLGVVADAAFGDPRRGHPVALFGTAAQKWEALLWRDSRWRGALFAASSVGAAVGCGIVASRIASRSGLLRITMTASATWAVLGAKSLAAEAHAVHKLLGRGDLAGGRNLSLGERCCLALTMRSDPPDPIEHRTRQGTPTSA